MLGRMMASGARSAQIAKFNSRQFSLLVPLQAKAQVPAEVQNTPLTNAFFADLEQKHTEYNESCKAQLKEMNQNLITNIIERGGNDGWDVKEDLSNMTKSFEFTSFEQAQEFCQHVSKFCNEKDHHPEWSLDNNGKTVNVLLTSHFANNTITRLDFEVAEAMNNSFYIIDRKFKMFPRFSEKQWSSFAIAFGSALLGSFLFVYFTSHPYPRRYRYATPEVPEEITTFQVDVKGLNSQDLEAYAEANVDKFAYAKMQRGQKNGYL